MMSKQTPERKRWDFHPTVRSGSELSIGERLADGMRLGMGSWTFIILFVTALIAWLFTGGFGADPSPYFRLNLILSCLAGLQAAMLLISDKRADRIRSDVARHHLEVSEEIHRMVAELHELHQHIEEKS